MQVILISGYKGSGKDYIANQLKTKYEAEGKEVYILKIAAVLKEMIACLFKITTDDLEKYKNNPYQYYMQFVKDETSEDSPTIVEQNIFTTDFREILQRFGTEVMQTFFGKNIWMEFYVKKLIEIKKANKDTIVITSDWRFPHEYETILSFKPETIRILNKNIENTDLHPSEIALDDFKFDQTIVNNFKQEGIR